MLPPRPVHGLLAVVALVVLAGCSADGGDDTSTPASPTSSSTPTRAPLTFEEATAAMSDTLVPAATVEHCAELEPGSPEEQEYLDQVAAEVATAEEGAAAPTLPQCGSPHLGDLRAVTLWGHHFAPDTSVTLPVAGGASRVLEVYELSDADAAQAAVAARAADAEGWAVDKEEPWTDHGDGTFSPRTIVSGAGVDDADLPGWTASVLTRDETSFEQDGSAAADPYSTAHLWASRDGIVIRVQVVGDAPGQAAATALETATRYVSTLGTD